MSQMQATETRSVAAEEGAATQGCARYWHSAGVWHGRQATMDLGQGLVGRHVVEVNACNGPHCSATLSYT
jgi:hypothetical protein